MKLLNGLPNHSLNIDINSGLLYSGKLSEVFNLVKVANKFANIDYCTCANGTKNSDR